jgi:anaerobic selenocysteine-containing dehydrogenase
MMHTYGDNRVRNHLSDIINSKLVVLFGNNPAETRMSGGGTIRDLVHGQTQKSGVRIIVIDPRHTDTAAGFADEWIPIRPGTDAALVSGLAHVLISEDLVDQEFLDRYCVGYDQATMPPGIPAGAATRITSWAKARITPAKTPEWAARISGIPARRIIQLAREIGTAKPAYIAQGWGPQRHAAGEQSARAICMLPILTGNVGIPGGNTGDREGSYGIGFPDVPVGENPVKGSIPCFLWTKAIADHAGLTALNSGCVGGTD